MNLVPSKLGTESKKKVVMLGALVALLVVIFIWNSTSSSTPSAVPVAPRAAVTPGATGPRTSASTTPSIMPAHRTVRGQTQSVDDFRPTLKLPDGTDVSKIDPALKLELLATLKNVAMEGGARSLFDFGQPPPPPTPKVDPIKPGQLALGANKGTDKQKEPDKPAGPPPPPPIPLKFYGYSNAARSGARRAFFLSGDEIFVAGENDMIQNRYKVIRIGVNSAVVEDTSNKHQQTLPLVEELPG